MSSRFCILLLFSAWVLIVLFVFFLVSFYYLLSNLSVEEHRRTERRRTNVITKFRLFPQGGSDVTFNQDWTIPPVNSRYEERSMFSTDRYLFSNFTFSKGLGNQMFQVASLHSIAKKNSAKLVLPDSIILRRAFSLNNQKHILFAATNTIDALLMQNRNRSIDFKDCCTYKDMPLTFDAGIAVVTGYLQNKRYFESDANDVYDMFNFHPEIIELAKSFVEQARIEAAVAKPEAKEGNPDDQMIIVEEDPLESTVTTVGVHIRHGIDIKMNTRNIKHGHVAATEEYYKKAMDLVKKEYGKVLFLICSDDIHWAKKTFKTKEYGNISFCDGKYREVDMAILANMDVLITSTGTFSWWSAYLNTNAQKIYYYSGWPLVGSPLDKMVNKTEFYPTEWIPVQ